MKNLTFGGGKFFWGALRGAGGPDIKNSKKPYTERNTENFSILAQSESLQKIRGTDSIFFFWGGAVRFLEFEKKSHTHPKFQF